MAHNSFLKLMTNLDKNDAWPFELIFIIVREYLRISSMYKDFCFNSSWKSNISKFFRYKCIWIQRMKAKIRNQISPCDKGGQGQPRITICANLVGPTSLWLHTKNCFTIYGNDGHLGHVPGNICANFHSSTQGVSIDCVIYGWCLPCFRVCSLLPCGRLLGKVWPLGSCLWCFIVLCHFPMWYPVSGVVLDCIDSWSLPPFLFWVELAQWYQNRWDGWGRQAHLVG